MRPDWENMRCSKVVMFLFRKTNKYPEQMRYRDAAPVRGLSKESALCHT